MVHVGPEKFVEEILRILKKGGVYNLMVFSVKEKFVTGPHKFTKEELRKIFALGR